MRKRNKKAEKCITLVTVAAILLAWFLVSNFTSVSDIILPSPQKVWKSFINVAENGYGTNGDKLITHLMSSMQRLMTAFGLVIVTAIPLGLLSGCFPKFCAVLDPIIEFYRPVPPLAYYTILVLWFGINESSKIILLYLAGFAPIFITCVSSVNHIKEDYINGAYMLGANKRQVFFNVILPATLPDIFTGLRTAVGIEYTTLVAAEMVAAKTGIGWLVLDASNWLKSDVVFFGVIIMGITGILLNQILLLLEKLIVHWSGKS
ncbi:MAG: ABC transporter permease [Oscillospiraceae bacterium]|nr:ABC transporter permease [Oscillospiraceae bacterium]